MIVAFCTKGYGVVFFIFLLKVAYLLLCFCPFVSFVNYFFRFTIYFSRALLRTFGDMGRDGEKREHGIGPLGRCCMGFPTCFFYLFIVSLVC